MPPQKCQVTTKNGQPCNAYAGAGSDYCYHHDPLRASERRLARSKGGRARHGRHIGPRLPVQAVTLGTMADVAALLEDTINATLQLENSIKRARTVGYLAGLLVRTLDFATLEERVDRLERALKLREHHR